MTKRHGQEDPASLANRVEAGDVRAVSRLITLLENHETAGVPALKKIRSPSRRSVVIGNTNYPGADISTLIDQMDRAYRRRGHTDGSWKRGSSTPYD